MSHQQQSRQQFVNYPYALNALDVKSQPAFRPGGRFTEQKRYFSGKHKLHGFEIECVVVLPGIAIHVSKHYPGSSSDLTICLENQDTHRQMLEKTEQEHGSTNYVEGASEYPVMWAMLVDKGYQGISNTLRGIHPKRKPRGAELTTVDFNRNQRLSSDRGIVENYFSRLSTLWRVMSTTFTWSESKYDQLVRLCVALTKFHVSLSPLRTQDHDHYDRQMARYVWMAYQAKRKRQRDSQLDDAQLALGRRRSSLERPASPASTTMHSQYSPRFNRYALSPEV